MLVFLSHVELISGVGLGDLDANPACKHTMVVAYLAYLPPPLMDFQQTAANSDGHGVSTKTSRFWKFPIPHTVSYDLIWSLEHTFFLQTHGHLVSSLADGLHALIS